MGVMAYLMVKGMLLLPENYKTAEMPMMLLTGSVHPLLGKFYAFGLWVAIFTTAIANAHSLTIRLSNKFRLTYHQLLFIILVTAFCFFALEIFFVSRHYLSTNGVSRFPLDFGNNISNYQINWAKAQTIIEPRTVINKFTSNKARIRAVRPPKRAGSIAPVESKIPGENEST